MILAVDCGNSRLKWGLHENGGWRKAGAVPVSELDRLEKSWRRLRPADKVVGPESPPADRKSTRLNSSHDQISYAVFCLKKKTGLETSALTRRRALTSWSFAVVIRRSTQRRSSFARASVVVMRPLSSSHVDRLLIHAVRASVSRLKRRPLFWWRIELG